MKKIIFIFTIIFGTYVFGMQKASVNSGAQDISNKDITEIVNLLSSLNMYDCLNLITKLSDNQKEKVHSALLSKYRNNLKSVIGNIGFTKIDNSIVKEFITTNCTINKAIISKDSKYIAAACSDHIIRLINLENNHIYDLSGHTNDINSIDFSPDCKILASASKDKTVKLWNLIDLEEKFIRAKNDSYINCVFNKENANILLQANKFINDVNQKKDKSEIDIENAEKLKNLIKEIRQEFKNTDDDAKSLKIRSLIRKIDSILKSSCTNLLEASFDEEITLPANDLVNDLIIDNQNNTFINSKELKLASNVLIVKFSPNGKHIACACRNNLFIYNIKKETTTNINIEVGYKVETVSFKPDSSCLLIGHGYYLNIFDIRGRKVDEIKLEQFGKNKQEIDYLPLTSKTHYLSLIKPPQVEYSLNGRFIFLRSLLPSVTSLDQIILLDNGVPKRILTKDIASKEHNDFIYAANFSPDSQYLITGCGNSNAIVWTLEDNKMLTLLKGHTDAVINADFDNTNKYALTAAINNSIKIWDFKNGQLIKELNQSNVTELRSAQLSFDNRYITASSLNKISLWDIDHWLNQLSLETIILLSKLTFIDPQDYLKENYLQHIVKLLGNTDKVINEQVNIYINRFQSKEITQIDETQKKVDSFLSNINQKIDSATEKIAFENNITTEQLLEDNVYDKQKNELFNLIWEKYLCSFLKENDLKYTQLLTNKLNTDNNQIIYDTLLYKYIKKLKKVVPNGLPSLCCGALPIEVPSTDDIYKDSFESKEPFNIIFSPNKRYAVINFCNILHDYQYKNLQSNKYTGGQNNLIQKENDRNASIISENKKKVELNNIYIWNLEENKKLKYCVEINNIKAISNNGKYLADYFFNIDDKLNYLRIWNIKENQIVRQIPSHFEISSASFNFSNNLISIINLQAKLEIWDIENNKEIFNTSLGRSALNIYLDYHYSTFSPNGDYLAVQRKTPCFSKYIFILNLITHEIINLFKSDDENMISFNMTFSPDSKNLALCDNIIFSLKDIEDKKNKAFDKNDIYQYLNKKTPRINYSESGTFIASATDDIIKIHNLNEKYWLTLYTGINDVTNVIFSPNEKNLILISGNSNQDQILPHIKNNKITKYDIANSWIFRHLNLKQLLLITQLIDKQYNNELITDTSYSDIFNSLNPRLQNFIKTYLRKRIISQVTSEDVDSLVSQYLEVYGNEKTDS